MKKEETIFFKLCFKYIPKNYYNTAPYTAREIINIIDDFIPHKRCWYYLKKWEQKGFYWSDEAIDIGYIMIDNIPYEYAKLITEELCKYYVNRT